MNKRSYHIVFLAESAVRGESIKLKLKKLVPSFLYDLLKRNKLRLLGVYDYVYDYRRFSRSSSTLRRQMTERQLASVITKTYHSLEKGIALPEPRARFGLAAIEKLGRQVAEYERRFGKSTPVIGARSAVEAYKEHHRKLGQSLPELVGFGPVTSESAIEAGARDVTRQEIKTASAAPFSEFVANRFSVRNYTGERVPIEQIESAIRLAMRSPRVCNRDTTKCYVAIDESMCKRVLSYQNGNRGFGHLAGAVLIVTSDMQGFTDFSERNQCWIDGGLFAMTLVYALHSQALGTCMLNWSVAANQDKRMRKEFGIPANEAVTTMIAVGILPEKFKVAVSPRAPFEDYIRILKD